MFQRDGDRITLSAELNRDEYLGFLLAWGMFAGAAFQRHPSLGWLLTSIMNRLMQGNPEFTQYEIPADRSQDFVSQDIRIVEVREPPKQ